jgi:hypothetical protein
VRPGERLPAARVEALCEAAAVSAGKKASEHPGTQKQDVPHNTA